MRERREIVRKWENKVNAGELLKSKEKKTNKRKARKIKIISKRGKQRWK